MTKPDEEPILFHYNVITPRIYKKSYIYINLVES